MGMFSSIGGLVGGYFGMPGIGTAVGGLLDSNKSVSRAGDLSGQVQGMSEEQYQRELPWDVSGQFGGIKYDREGRAVSTELSAPWQQQMDRLMGRAGTTADQIDKYSADPVEFGMQLAGKRKDLMRPADEREMLTRESRGLAQGTFGTRGFAGREQAAQEAIHQRNLGYDIQGYQDALRTGTTLRDWEQTEREGAIGVGKLPLQYKDLAKSGGISNDPYREQKVEGLKGVSKARGMRYDEFGNLIEDAFGGMLGGNPSNDALQRAGMTVSPTRAFTT
ncbi:MAG: hypothetical protein ABGY11_11690 [Candidatus Thioglobus sp.]